MSAHHVVSGGPSRPTSIRVLPAVVLCVVAWCVFPGDGLAEEALSEGWVSFDGVTTTPSPPELHVLSASTSELVVEIRTPGALCASVVEGEMEFVKLELPGYDHSGDVGHPALPAVRQLFALPRGAAIDVAAATTDSMAYSGSVIYPVPAEVTHYTREGWPYPAEEFAYDEQAYGRNGYYPEDTADAGSSGTLRGQGVALLTVHPIRYDPVAEKTKVYPIVRVTLTFTGGSGGVSGDLGPFDSIAERVLLNYTGFGGRGGRPQGGPGDHDECMSLECCADTIKADYLMIVDDHFEPPRFFRRLCYVSPATMAGASCLL